MVAFEDERALTARRGLEHGLKDELHGSLKLWSVLSSHLPRRALAVCVVALAEDVPLQGCQSMLVGLMSLRQLQLVAALVMEMSMGASRREA